MTKSDCQPLLDALAPYLADAVEPSRRAELDAHVRACSACQTRLAAQRDLDAVLSGLLAPTLSSAAAGRIDYTLSTLGQAGPVTPTRVPWGWVVGLLIWAILLGTSGRGAARTSPSASLQASPTPASPSRSWTLPDEGALPPPPLRPAPHRP